MGAPNHCGGRRKVLTMSQMKYFLQQNICFPKDLMFEHRGAKLVSFPRRHPNSLRPWSGLSNLFAFTRVRRGEATVPWPPPQTLKIKNVKTVLSKTCFQNAQKCVFLGVILQNFPGGMRPDLPRIVVPSALPLKLICDVTRLWRNLALPRKFSA